MILAARIGPHRSKSKQNVSLYLSLIRRSNWRIYHRNQKRRRMIEQDFNVSKKRQQQIRQFQNSISKRKRSKIQIYNPFRTSYLLMKRSYSV